MYGTGLPTTGLSFLVYGTVALALGVASGVAFLGRKLFRRPSA